MWDISRTCLLLIGEVLNCRGLLRLLYYRGRVEAPETCELGYLLHMQIHKIMSIYKLYIYVHVSISLLLPLSLFSSVLLSVTGSVLVMSLWKPLRSENTQVSIISLFASLSPSLPPSLSPSLPPSLPSSLPPSLPLSFSFLHLSCT